MAPPTNQSVVRVCSHGVMKWAEISKLLKSCAAEQRFETDLEVDGKVDILELHLFNLCVGHRGSKVVGKQLEELNKKEGGAEEVSKCPDPPFLTKHLSEPLKTKSHDCQNVPGQLQK